MRFVCSSIAALFLLLAPGAMMAQANLDTLTRDALQMKVEEIESFERRANAGDPEAQTALALAYHHGNFLIRDPEKALEWFRKAADQGFLPAEEALGMEYQLGQDTAKNPAEAVRWYTRAAEQGSALAASNIALMCLQGDGVPQSASEAVRWFTVAAESGDATAQANLGRMYQQGQGVLADPFRAAQWLRKAANQGLAQAQFELALLDQQGAPPTNSAEAIQMLLKAADQGHVPAQTRLGYTYLKGIGVPADPSQSLMWYRIAAKQGDPTAAYAISVHYLSKKSPTAVEYEEAFRWTVVAAEKGRADAQYNAGVLSEKGLGTKPDAAAAGHWYELAANQGYADAQYRLGQLYGEGRGVPNDPVTAYKWLLLARDKVENGPNAIADLQRTMTPAQVKQAEALADEWRAQHQQQPEPQQTSAPR